MNAEAIAAVYEDEAHEHRELQPTEADLRNHVVYAQGFLRSNGAGWHDQEPMGRAKPVTLAKARELAAEWSAGPRRSACVFVFGNYCESVAQFVNGVEVTK